jgi:hypothetical protein
MKNIIITGAIIKYPWGGLIQYWTAWFHGLKSLGYKVYYVEDVSWEYACYNVETKMMINDPSYGIMRVVEELKRFDMQNSWCFIDHNETHYGMSKQELIKVFKEADVFIDTQFDTLPQYSMKGPLRVLLDGEPGWNQIGIKNMIDSGESVPFYDAYFSLGLNIGTPKAMAPDLGITWERMMVPVLIEPTPYIPISKDASFTTVMAWQANPVKTYEGKTYGMKDVEFQKFLELPKLVNQKMEIAVSGPNVPWDLLKENGWNVVNADDISVSLKSYRKYINGSKGEFSVAKNAHVATKNGMFLERSGYYLLAGRPVVLQDTGWSEYLPTGRGLFAVNSLDEAVDAIDQINGDYQKHARWANEVAMEYLDAVKTIGGFMETLKTKYGRM